MPDFRHPEPKQVTRAKRTADAFRPNDRMEALLLMREQRPAAYAALPPNVVIAAGLYESDRAVHQQINEGNPA